MKSIKQAKEVDWVIMRLLYILMASDVSNLQIPDVVKTLDYLKYRRKLHIEPCFDLINKDHVEKKTLENNPNSAMIRRFDSERQKVEDAMRGTPEDPEVRKYFGDVRFILKLAEAYRSKDER